jgi:hypothetical protein
MRLLPLVWLAAVAISPLPIGCRGESSRASPGSSPPNFDLVCDSTETAKQATLFCVRHDTRDGDVKVVDLNKIPRSQGSTAAAAGGGGRYKLVCRSADTPEQGDFRCVRLDTVSGDLLLVTLPKVDTIPE